MFFHDLEHFPFELLVFPADLGSVPVPGGLGNPQGRKTPVQPVSFAVLLHQLKLPLRGQLPRKILQKRDPQFLLSQHPLKLRDPLLVSFHLFLAPEHLSPVLQEMPLPVRQRGRMHSIGPGHLGLGAFTFSLQGLQHHLELERLAVPRAALLHRAPPSSNVHPNS